jgi:hypothetical protein
VPSAKLPTCLALNFLSRSGFRTDCPPAKPSFGSADHCASHLGTSPDNSPTTTPLAPWSPMTNTHFPLSNRSLSLPHKKQGAKWCVPRRYFTKQTIKSRLPTRQGLIGASMNVHDWIRMSPLLLGGWPPSRVRECKSKVKGSTRFCAITHTPYYTCGFGFEREGKLPLGSMSPTPPANGQSAGKQFDGLMPSTHAPCQPTWHCALLHVTPPARQTPRLPRRGNRTQPRVAQRTLGQQAACFFRHPNGVGQWLPTHDTPLWRVLAFSADPLPQQTSRTAMVLEATTRIL